MQLLSQFTQGRSSWDGPCSKPSEPASCDLLPVVTRRQKWTPWSLLWPLGLAKLSKAHPLHQICEMLQKFASFQCLLVPTCEYHTVTLHQRHFGPLNPPHSTAFLPLHLLWAAITIFRVTPGIPWYAGPSYMEILRLDEGSLAKGTHEAQVKHYCRKNWFPDVVASGFRNFNRGRDMPWVRCK